MHKKIMWFYYYLHEITFLKIGMNLKDEVYVAEEKEFDIKTIFYLKGQQTTMYLSTVTPKVQ